ncbi:Nif3-like dinuclear metal center hexameric protein [Bythopirellula polymerisocia]|uniref:GTP cyclohydrolase 1 type 2 homolog n=1 Tax=Bythopirellula polymerisocia TaxID=2528003 RepID=A0A5C6CRM5_9BACT|nr:Nif3-like dinuclear metal center hexameric protein [Bythopirellula polymerisocia]TWU26111.1 GTP cyclohydrolase 1 type 2 [Bythopirellula polymerisocia]
MSTVGKVVEYIDQVAPLSLAEDWDNVGLLVGDRVWSVERLLTCLTITPAVVAEAIEGRANLIVTHHPLPFHALKNITADTTVGRLLLNLISARIAVYSAHTAFDSARAGINQHLAIGLGLQEIVPLFPRDVDDADIGAGRSGILGEDVPLLEMAKRVKQFLSLEKLQLVGQDDQVVSRIAIACGSGGSFLDRAIELDCDCLITGETNFHTCLEAEARGVALILPGHFASERFGMISLADYLGDLIPEITVWASQSEEDPLRLR